MRKKIIRIIVVVLRTEVSKIDIKKPVENKNVERLRELFIRDYP